MKKEKNFLEMVPKISEKIEIEKKGELITISYERNTLVDKVFNFIFRKPARIFIELDEIGTKAIEFIDGNRDIGKICELLDKELGEKVHPVVQRTTQFMVSLNRNGFIVF
jgi:hypothetical protein